MSTGPEGIPMRILPTLAGGVLLVGSMAVAETEEGLVIFLAG